jgi:beta-galactosidase/beta-glucuronidase
VNVPRSEYPRPQFVRSDWLCLNGPWEFAIDQGDSGLERGLREAPLPLSITVPFCPESDLSGIGNTDHLNAVWYRRTVRVPAPWRGRRVLLHFQAVDYDATVWVNGREVARHRGGFTPFSADITEAAPPGAQATIVVRARDDHRQRKPRGKQSTLVLNRGCHYTRTTGIWQTVWMEAVSDVHLGRPRITPDLAAGAIAVEAPLSLPRSGCILHATLRQGRTTVARASVASGDALWPRLVLSIPTGRRRPWSPEDPFLYGLELALLDETSTPVDRLQCYAGLRSVAIDQNRLLLNGRPVFQRLVLDQGYWPDGIMTAPSDRALVRDIELARAAGFNGARLHQKVFEERFLYHADRLGWLVWGEFADWAGQSPRPADWAPVTYVTQWCEALARDHSHPSIIGWCPLNETQVKATDPPDAFDDLTSALVRATRLADPSRPVIDASGWTHRVADADVYDIHCYEQDPAKLAAHVDERLAGKTPSPQRHDRDDLPYHPRLRRPFIVSEFGGIWWNAQLAAAAARGDQEAASWGYGNRPRDIEEFCRRFEGLCAVLLENPAVAGYCYTQLTDVFQEQNGVVGFDRSAKFDLARLAAAQRRPAAIEVAPAPKRPSKRRRARPARRS